MGIAYNTSIIRDGLTSQIDFANSKIGSTNPRINLVKDANTFTGYNSPVISNGVFQADGLNPGSYFGENVAGTGLGNHGTNSFTYQFLINPKASTSINSAAEARILEQGGWPDTYVIFRILHNGGNPYYSLILKDLTNSVANSGFATPSNTVVLNQWVFLTVVVDRTSGHGRIYINNTKYETAMTYGSAQYGNDDPVTFPSGYAEIQADYSCVLIYNRALTDAEVNQNYQALRGRFNI